MTVNKNTFLRLSLLSFIIAGIAFIYPQKINSIPPKNVKNTLSTSQYSYYGGVGVGNTAGSTILILDTSTDFPSQTSNNLFIGDTLNIGIGGSQSLHTIKDIGSTGVIMIDPALTAVNEVAGGSIIATRSAIHTVSFEPQDTATGDIWQVLIKATSGIAAEKSSDGIPDQLGFDYGTLNQGAVTCPWGATASVGTTTSLSMGSPPVTSYYHVIQCALAAGTTNPAGTGATGTIIIGTNTNALINPSPSHDADGEGNADIFSFIVRHLDSGSNLIDQSSGKIAIVESVRVTATIDPSLTFYIDSVGTSSVGSTACGAGSTLSSGASDTTGDQVIFGTIAIQAINQLAQRLTCVTNASGGYVVTAYEGGVMTKIGAGDTIPDTLCNGMNCTITQEQSWVGVSSTRSEFGYTMTNIGSSIPFNETDFKPFGIGYANAQPIMINPSVPSTSESANVCYRLTATTIQAAGDYEAKIIYTATATF